MAAFAALSLLQRTGLSEEVSLPRNITVGRVYPRRTTPLRASSSNRRRSQFNDIYLFLAAEEAASSIRQDRRWWSIHRTGGQEGFLGSKGTAMVSNRSCVSCTRQCGRLRGHAVFENIPCGLQDVPVLVSAHGTGP